MKAFVLAAGLGTRLKPLTDTTPKALVKVGGVPMLERVLRRLAAAGVDEAIVNVHHHAQQVADFLVKKNDMGRALGLKKLAISLEEPKVLETGGGLKKAAWFFDDGRPFFMHNADVLTDLDLQALLRAHEETDALATLAVMKRESSRALLFSKSGWLAGRREKGVDELVSGGEEPLEALPFAGVHVVSPALLPRITEEGVFSIVKTYLRLAREGERIRAWRCDGALWVDIGDAQKLAKAEAAVKERGL